MTSRREFLAGGSAALAAGLTSSLAGECGAEDAPASAPADHYLLQSQPLPEPRVILPTDNLPPPQGKKKRIAAITTAYFKYSHADDIITKFIEGYGILGRTHLPHCQVVSLYVDQFPETDIARGMAARYKIPLAKTPAEALTAGGDELAVDGVLLVGEHGDYPTNEKGQKLYPRRKLYEQIVDVFRKTGQSAPIFNDKHLSYSWENAEWMHRQSRELNFPLMAGSSVPVAWRRPPLAFRPGIPLESALVVGYGGFESYGFHCLELLQSFVERRPGGETGVKAVQALSGEAAASAAQSGKWPAGLVPAAIAPARKPAEKPYDPGQLIRTTVFRVEFSDGFEAAVCLGGGLAYEFCFAARVKGREEPVATYAYLPKPQRDHFSFLCNHIEYMFRSGRASYPVKRTLLVSGVLDALHDSRAAGGARIETPHLRQLAYTPAAEVGAS